MPAWVPQAEHACPRTQALCAGERRGFSALSDLRDMRAGSVTILERHIIV
jgi:hypothetical protein